MADDRPTAWEHMLDPGTDALQRLAKKAGKAETEDPELRKYTRVLQFMHWAKDQPQGKNLPLGELLKLGCKSLDLPEPSPEVERALLVTAFKLISIPYPKSGI